jgi:hypothetical protein
MLDNHYTGGAALVRLPSAPTVWRAVRITDEWNGFPVPVFTTGEAWGILTALNISAHEDYDGRVSYWDADNGVQYLTAHADGVSFNGWAFELVHEVTRETVDTALNIISETFELEFFMTVAIETVEEFLSPNAGEYANGEARNLVRDYYERLRDAFEYDGLGDANEFPLVFAVLNEVDA